jgi:hypothetical protein
LGLLFLLNRIRIRHTRPNNHSQRHTADILTGTLVTDLTLSSHSHSHESFTWLEALAVGYSPAQISAKMTSKLSTFECACVE